MGLGRPDLPLENISVGSEYVVTPKMSHSFIRNCCWITLQVSHHQRMKDLCQKWKVRLIFWGAWNSLMAWPDWPRPPLFYDRSTPLYRLMQYDCIFLSMTRLREQTLKTKTFRDDLKDRKGIAVYGNVMFPSHNGPLVLHSSFTKPPSPLQATTPPAH